MFEIVLVQIRLLTLGEIGVLNEVPIQTIRTTKKIPMTKISFGSTKLQTNNPTVEIILGVAFGIAIVYSTIVLVDKHLSNSSDQTRILS